MPRFVYFGPHTHDESLRLAFLAGFDGGDLRAALALTDFVGDLIASPDLGQGLNLSFFPLIDVIGTGRGEAGRELAREHWGRPVAPEINVLEKDARLRGYHGFIRLEASPEVGAITAQLRGTGIDAPPASGVELIASDDFAPHAVRWEGESLGQRVSDGPLSVVDDLPVRPFELTLRFPADFDQAAHRAAVASILTRLILRQRAIQAYGQHL